MVISQSSNSARSVGPAWPVKVISYACDCFKIAPRSLLIQSVPPASIAARACVITRPRVTLGAQFPTQFQLTIRLMPLAISQKPRIKLPQMIA